MSGPVLIPISRGMVTLVDPADAALVLQFRWSAKPNRERFYAYSSAREARPALYLHRLLLGCPPGFQVDHINGDTLDNRRQNLRVCTPRQNRANVPATRASRSGHKGVVRDLSCRSWRARIKIGGVDIHLGNFETPEAAARAYDAAARHHYGEFARLTFPDSLPTRCPTSMAPDPCGGGRADRMTPSPVGPTLSATTAERAGRIRITERAHGTASRPA